MEGPKKRYPSLSRGNAPDDAPDDAPDNAPPGNAPHHGDEAAGEGSARETSARDASARDTSVLSRKELARELRRQAYQRAKQARATDPRHLAMKQAAKVRRREVYQQVKGKRKEHEAELKARRKVADAAARVETQRQLAETVRSALHGQPVIPTVGAAGSAAHAAARHGAARHAGADQAAAGGVSGPSSKRARASSRGMASALEPGEAATASSDIAREMAEALEDPDIKDLMARLRAESARLAQLAAQQQSPPACLEEADAPSEGCRET
jgi:hypothetical protein